MTGLDKVSKFFSIWKVVLSSLLAALTFVVWILSVSADVKTNADHVETNKDQIVKLGTSFDKEKELLEKRRDKQIEADRLLLKALGEMTTETKLLKQRLELTEERDEK